MSKICKYSLSGLVCRIQKHVLLDSDLHIKKPALTCSPLAGDSFGFSSQARVSYSKTSLISLSVEDPAGQNSFCPPEKSEFFKALIQQGTENLL